MSIPTNIVDVAAQIKNGEIGVIDIIKIGDVAVSALTGLQAPVEKEITSRPVQAGFTVVDGMINVPQQLIMDIVLANPSFAVEAGVTAALTGEWAGFTDTWVEKKDQLYAQFNARWVGPVQTHEGGYPSMAIKRIEPRYDNEQNWKCFIATVTLAEFDNRQTQSADDVDDAMTAGRQYVGAL